MRKGYIHCHIDQNEADAFLIDEGKFVKFGTSAEITELTGNDELIDLKQMSVLPGFVDSHMHLAELGEYLSEIQLIGVDDAQELKQKIVNYHTAHPDAAWLVGRGYDDTKMNGPLNRLMLDEIAVDLPICLRRIDGHVLVCNTRALEEAGINEETETAGGTIDLEHGILYENALNLVLDQMPQPSEERIRHYIETGMKAANQYGITTVGSDDFLSVTNDQRAVLNVFEQMSYQEALTVRVNEQCEFADPKEFSSFLDDGYTMDVGNDFFRIGPLKLIADGTLGAATAALSEPYSNSDNAGIAILDEDDIRMFTQLAARFNMGTIVHAIGDGAVDTVLHAFSDSVYEGNPLHCGLVHCQIMRPDQIETIIKHHYSCYVQSLFEEEDGRILVERVGAERAKSCYPFTTLLQNTLTSNGSDAPVCMPDVIHGISEAVNGAEGITETMSVREAIDSYTVNGAQQLFMQDTIGKMQEGYSADFVVLDQDLTACNPKEIRHTKVMMTVMNGEEVYSR